MKYIEKKYQQLINDMERAYDNVCDTLKYHINELQKTVVEKTEEIEKLKEGDKLQAEIDEYNRLEAQKNMNLEDEITQLRAKLTETNNELKLANGAIKTWEERFYTLAKSYNIDLDKPVKSSAVVQLGGSKPKARKTHRHRHSNKTVVAYCKDCGAYFQAKSKLAKYCNSCKKKRAKESHARWIAKQK